MIPENVRLLFWDIDASTFDPRSYPDYTIARVLEYGDGPAVRWLRTLFSEAEIKRVIASERRLSRKSATFWALVYGLPLEQVSALREPPGGQAAPGLFPDSR